MNIRRLMQVAVVAAFTPACGAELAEQPIELSETLVEEQGLESEDGSLPADVVAKIKARYARLRAAGALQDRNWALNTEPPADQTYVSLDLEDDADRGLNDGYSVTAMVPVDDGIPRFYIVRVGGVAGWQFLAGPYAMDAQTVALTEQNAGQTAVLTGGSTVVVELLSNPSTGYAWTVEAPELGKASEQYTPDMPIRPGSGGKTRFVWNNVGEAAKSGQAFKARFVYKRVGDQQADKELTFQLRIK